MAAYRKLDALLERAVADGTVGGVAAGIVSSEGVLHSHVAGPGLADDTLFWIASMTKAITSLAAVLQVERGLLSLDAPLSQVLPELAEIDLLTGFASDGTPLTRHPKRQVTLTQLLSHTSGFAEYLWHRDAARYHAATGLPTGATGKRDAMRLPLLFEPGTVWQYGNSHDWVGLAVERSSGRRLDRFLADELFSPMGIGDTTYFPDAGQASRVAPVYRRRSDGTLERFQRDLLATREYLPGGGGMFSALGDYLSIVRMILGGGTFGGRRILAEATVEALAINRTGTLPVSRLTSTNPALSHSLEFMPGIRKAWGLGFMVNLQPCPSGRQVGTLSWAGLGNTYFWIDQASGLGGVLMAQLLPFADPRVLKLAEAFETAAYAAAA